MGFGSWDGDAVVVIPLGPPSAGIFGPREFAVDFCEGGAVFD